MKALSLRQPWAYLVASGEKTIEVRSWRTDYRGKLLICSSQSEKNYFFEVAEDFVEEFGNVLLMPYGVSFCMVDLVDVRTLTEADREGAFLEDDFDISNQYAWVLENPVPVRFEKVFGKLRLFEVDDEKIIPVLTTNEWLKRCKAFAPDAKPNKGSLILEYE
ncbi:MAG: ASCH domain-containing protein [[Pasteurella] mairii]|uniref:ASCH domain n=1 Tax=[Pasteurella] mairii TaxID=757 RepID=A0A379B5I5_9PAST|nr:ASCH domain-containing protein [[Pasteurella] mairii]SUB33320.1 ASCH domain [[Pasteurella] mairii]